MELLLAEHPVDLRAAAGILLNDVGATLEIFRRAGEEYGEGPDMPARLEDCLACLSTDVWMEAICGGAVERAADGAALAQRAGFWEHARLLAYACWAVAEQTDGVCPEEAFLVGLLHEAAYLPALLGWSYAGNVTAAELRAHWRLPDHLWPVAAGSSAMLRWRRILDLAHSWSLGDDCLLTCTA